MCEDCFLDGRDRPNKIMVFEDPLKRDEFLAVYCSSIYGALVSRADDPRDALRAVIAQRKAVQS